MSSPAGSRRGLGTGPMILLGVAVATVAMAGLGQIGNLVGPLFLSLTLAITGRPAVVALRRRGVKFAPLIVLLGSYLVLLAMVAAIVASGVSLATTLPDYQNQFNDVYQSALAFLKDHGVTSDQINTAFSKVDVNQIVGVAQSLLGGLSSFSSQLITMLIALAFLTLDTATVHRRGAELAQARPHLARALADFSIRVRQYWIVSSVFGLIVAVFNYIALLILNVPLAFTWAVLSFVTNYIPNVGFFMALIPAALLALVSGGFWTMVWTIIAFSVINVVIQTFIQPRFVGNTVGLSMTLTFVSLLFWTIVIGPMGAILAVPLTLFFRALIIGSTPSLQWLDVFFRPNDNPRRDVREEPPIRLKAIDDGIDEERGEPAESGPGEAGQLGARPIGRLRERRAGEDED
ncbi:MAG: AI-2E family transporter [Nostocoides sp.]